MQRGAGGEGVSAAVEALERRRAAAQADDTRRRTDVGHDSELRRQLRPSTGGIGDLQVAELGRHWGEVGGPQPQKHGRDRR